MYVCDIKQSIITYHLTAPEIYGLVLTKQLLIQGFIVLRWFNKYNEAWSDLLKWIKEVYMSDKTSVGSKRYTYQIIYKLNHRGIHVR